MFKFLFQVTKNVCPTLNALTYFIKGAFKTGLLQTLSSFLSQINKDSLNLLNPSYLR